METCKKEESMHEKGEWQIWHVSDLGGEGRRKWQNQIQCWIWGKNERMKSDVHWIWKVCKQKSYWLFLKLQMCHSHVHDEVHQSRKEAFWMCTCLMLGFFLCLKKGLLLLRRRLGLLGGVPEGVAWESAGVKKQKLEFWWVRTLPNQKGDKRWASGRKNLAQL